ncbi:hypothetical protein [Streptomyces sp. bgisy159]|uniref:hypothetical protein n=1 Tax=Streptomyces sp. bgisy159 TaxID=3413795 RepID=UPI003F49D6EA
MSRYIDIAFEFNKANSVSSIIGALVGGGWRPDDDGRIKFLVEPDLFDWEDMPLDCDCVAIEKMEVARIVNGSCAIILTWENTGIGVSFLISSAGRQLSVDPRVDTVYRRDVDIYVDFEWYISKILPSVSGLGLSGYRISDLPA